MADEKKNLRAIMSACRDALSAERAAASSQAIQRRLIASDFYRTASAIVLYHAHRNEVSTDLVLSDALAGGRAVFYPRVDPAAGTMVARRVRDRLELAPGAYGMLEPSEAAEALDSAKFTKILVCVPGLAFGLEGARLGRGGGHYDRFIGQMGAEAISVGLAYSFQLLDRIPATELDRRLNIIVTESAVLRAGQAPLPVCGTRTKEVNPGGTNHRNPGIHSWWRGLFHLGSNQTA